MNIDLNKPRTYIVGVTLHGQAVTIFTQVGGGFNAGGTFGGSGSSIWIQVANETEPTLFARRISMQSANIDAATMAKDFEAWLNRHGDDDLDCFLRRIFGYKGVVWLKGNEVGQGDIEGWEIVE